MPSEVADEIILDVVEVALLVELRLRARIGESARARRASRAVKGLTRG